MKPFFKELFEYTFRTNESVIELLITTDEVVPNERLVLLVNHTINAHEIWNSRILGNSCSTGVWDIRPADSLKKQNELNYQETLRILNDISLYAEITYKNSKGSTYQNSVHDILFHIINHSTYHRGQIASYYKQEGGNPLVTDYIFYKRDAL